MTVIEAVAGRSWKAVELFGALRLCVSQIYLRSGRVNRVIETDFIATPRSVIILEPFT